jgi:hypothetical protein
MTELGDLIGGIMAGLTRARRDADVTSAIVAEEYRIHSLLSAVSAPRVRLSEVTIDLPVILSTEGDEKMARRSGAAMTHSAVLQALVSRLTELGISAPIITQFIALAEPDLATLFGDEVRGISGESISRIAQKSISAAFEASQGDVANPTLVSWEEFLHRHEGMPEKEVQALWEKYVNRQYDLPSSVEKAPQESDNPVTVDSVRIALDLESRRIGRELTAEWPRIEAIAETQSIRDMGSEASITRIQLKLIEEGLEWTTLKDEQGNRISRLMSE